MLRLARWMADYYLCPLGTALEAIVPAGVRHDVGSREVTLLAAALDAAERAAKLKLSAKQAAALQILLSSGQPMLAKELAEQAGCTAAPINELRKKGLIVSSVERQNSQRLLNDVAAAAIGARVESRPGSSPRSDPQCARSSTAPHDSHSRRHRQRQDRSLHSGD